MEYCLNCEEWCEPDINEVGYPTVRGYYSASTCNCPQCHEETTKEGLFCNECGCHLDKADAVEIVDDYETVYVCDGCFNLEEEE